MSTATVVAIATAARLYAIRTTGIRCQICTMTTASTRAATTMSGDRNSNANSSGISVRVNAKLYRRTSNRSSAAWARANTTR
jgi:hypothetical protein